MNNEEIWTRFPLKRGRFNGKGKKHWEREAAKLVVAMLVRASNLDHRSAIGAIASNRLLELARAESPELYAEIVGERDRCRKGFARVMREILGD